LSGAFIVPPVPHASRSFVLAATRLRALRLDPLVTGSELPFAEQTPKKTRIRPLAPGPRLHREIAMEGPPWDRAADEVSADAREHGRSAQTGSCVFVHIAQALGRA